YGLSSNLIVEDSSEVWVTFIHEGAGWKNVLGYYTYTTGNPPATTNDINEHILLFPNVSYSGSGGGLTSGDKIFIDTIPGNTSIGWFLVAQGWNSGTSQVGNGTHVLYSDSHLNPEADTSLQKHCVLLYDEYRELFIMGFEDIIRTGGDHDFNDAVFTVIANPIENTNRDTTERTDPVNDADGDGVADVSDDYPNDPNKAFDNYYPSETTFGTLAFEDLWPGKGDYDFNDLVIGYNLNSITNADNDVVEIEQKIVVRAFGASMHNGFGIEFNTPASNTSVTGGMGTVAGTNRSVIMSFVDSYEVLTYPSDGGIGVNTTVGGVYIQPDTIYQTVTFTSPVDVAQLGTAPYNPFIRINEDITHEIHLPDYAPTELAENSALFGTAQDDSDAAIGRYYKTENNLPWAINIPVEFHYPIEKAEIVSAHLKFGSWATSNGLEYTDWYLEMANYRNAANIFTH
ncbi:MAG: LruC domain-containing protein, partial [Bacteroidetes bacterium]|nr:LruC domain-containing protein [Bacteroidota bacterium]